MRTLTIKSIVAFAVPALLFAACQKEESTPKQETENPPKEVTKENLVGSYLLTKIEARSAGQRSDITGTWFNSYAGNCTRDDITTFNPDNSFVVLDGTVECDESTDDTGTWELIDNTRLRIDKDTATVEALSDTTLRVINPVYSNAQREIIFTYQRK